MTALQTIAPETRDADPVSEHQPPFRQGTAVVARRATRGTILVVDDRPGLLTLLTKALERAGYAAQVASGGEAALAIAGRITPDLVLMDAVMPGLDGFESCRRLKARPALAGVPVIFMTALTDTQHVVQGLAAGGVDYVTKPIDLDALFARITVHLGNARAARGAQLALDVAGSFMLAVDRAGQLLWSTPQATALLDTAFGRHDALPRAAGEAVATAVFAGEAPPGMTLPGRSADETLHLTFIGAAGQGEYLFRLSRKGAEGEVLRRRFGLTSRETEVLTWVAGGKSNRDVGEILNLSPRTVNKHLEVIFRKLGVENRASAAVLATRVLDER